MKICTKCKKEKQLSEFNFRNKSKGTYCSWCQECFRSYERVRWAEAEQSDELKKRHKRNSYLSRLRNQQFIWDYLMSHPCECCGEKDPVVLQFDHIDRTGKTIGISVASRSCASIERIKEEISKCRVLCANCHMRRTAKQMGWYKKLTQVRILSP